jgi:hypothetical protein
MIDDDSGHAGMLRLESPTIARILWCRPGADRSRSRFLTQGPDDLLPGAAPWGGPAVVRDRRRTDWAGPALRPRSVSGTRPFARASAQHGPAGPSALGPMVGMIRSTAIGRGDGGCRHSLHRPRAAERPVGARRDPVAIPHRTGSPRPGANSRKNIEVAGGGGSPKQTLLRPRIPC